MTGPRLIASVSTLLRAMSADKPIRTLPAEAVVSPIEGNFSNVVLVRVGRRVQSDEIRDRAIAAITTRRTPWFCQRCGGASVCPKCDALMTPVPMATLLSSDGSTAYVPTFAGYARRCTNRECSTHPKNAGQE